MSVSKIKNLILLILALTAAFLLVLVVPSRTRQSREARELHERLSKQFEAYDVTLEGDSLPASATLFTVEPAGTDELTAMRALLGETVQAAETATRYETRYVSELGECSLTHNGQISCLLQGGKSVRDPEGNTRKLLRGMQLQAAELETEQTGGTVTVHVKQQLLGVPVCSEGLDFTYENDILIAVTGTVFLRTDSLMRTSEQTCISCADALVRLLSGRDSLGWMGSRISGMEQGYQPVETASGMRLIPVWRLETDTGTVVVNGITREVELETGT